MVQFILEHLKTLCNFMQNKKKMVYFETLLNDLGEMEL